MPAPDPKDTWAYRKAGGIKTTGSLAPRPGRCGAQLTFTGTSAENPPRYCQQHPALGNTRCTLLHGGKQQKADPARVLSSRVREGAARLANDPHLLSLRPEIALEKASAEILQDRADAVDGAAVSRQLLEAIDRQRVARLRFRQATTAKVRKAAWVALDHAMSAVDAARVPAATEVALRQELREARSAVANLTDKENKRIEQLHGMISVDRALAAQLGLVRLVVQLVGDYVTDPALVLEFRRDLARRFARFGGVADGGDGQALAAAGGSAEAITTGGASTDGGGPGELVGSDVGLTPAGDAGLSGA